MTAPVDTVPEPIGRLLARLRASHGWSQLHLAERLCDAAGCPTVSRHEISRWERGERLPGRFWRDWLSAVFGVPAEELADATLAARKRRQPDRAEQWRHRLWRMPEPGELLAALDRSDLPDLRPLAHAWVTGPPEPSPHLLDDGADPADTRLAQLRRLDDRAGGQPVAALADGSLRRLIRALPGIRHSRRRRALGLIAEYGQLAGWAHAETGDLPAARRAHRVALQAAAAAGDPRLTGYVLASLSHQLLDTKPAEALQLAQVGHTGARTAGCALTEALLLHRVALAAARLGEARSAYTALRRAEQALDRADPGQRPSWLYWFDDRERAAMTGRCLAVLGRPLRAAQLLTAYPSSGGPRTGAIYAAWLARSQLALGEVEQACRTATLACTRAAAAGSTRAIATVNQLRPLLRPYRHLAAARRYDRIATASAAPTG